MSNWPQCPNCQRYGKDQKVTKMRQLQADMAEQFEHTLDAFTTLPTRVETTNTILNLLHTQVVMLRGNKKFFNDSEQILQNHLLPFSSRFIDEAKLYFFYILPRNEAIDFFQSPTISLETTLSDALSKLRKKRFGRGRKTPVGSVVVWSNKRDHLGFPKTSGSHC